MYAPRTQGAGQSWGVVSETNGAPQPRPKYTYYGGLVETYYEFELTSGSTNRSYLMLYRVEVRWGHKTFFGKNTTTTGKQRIDLEEIRPKQGESLEQAYDRTWNKMLEESEELQNWGRFETMKKFAQERGHKIDA